MHWIEDGEFAEVMRISDKTGRFAFFGGPRDGEVESFTGEPPALVAARGGEYGFWVIFDESRLVDGVGGYVWNGLTRPARSTPTADPGIAWRAFRKIRAKDRRAERRRWPDVQEERAPIRPTCVLPPRPAEALPLADIGGPSVTPRRALAQFVRRVALSLERVATRLGRGVP